MAMLPGFLILAIGIIIDCAQVSGTTCIYAYVFIIIVFGVFSGGGGVGCFLNHKSIF